VKYFIYFLLSLTLYADIDYDFDGVDDSIDRCLDTPFDKSVDKYGCPEDEFYVGKLNFELLYTHLLEDSENSASFYLDYNYNNLLLSLSSAYASDYTHQDSLLVGYRFNFTTYLLNLYLGIEEDELFLSSTYEYFWKDYIALLSLNYYNQESKYISYMLGFGRVYDTLGVNIYYMSSGSASTFSDEYRSVESVVSYSFSKSFYLKGGVNYSIVDEKVYDIYVAVGASFE
jgi:hypothetical protein